MRNQVRYGDSTGIPLYLGEIPDNGDDIGFHCSSSSVTVVAKKTKSTATTTSSMYTAKSFKTIVSGYLILK